MVKITDKTLKAYCVGSYPIGEGDTLGLRLIITKGKNSERLNRQFVFQYKWRYPDKETTHRLGLGGYPSTSLKKARELAKEARGYLTEKPKRNPKAVWGAAATERDGRKTFGEVATEYLDSKLKQFSNAKHQQQWRNTLTEYAAPIWDAPVKDVEVGDVLRCIEPIWGTKRETATRVRARIEAVLAAARVKGYRQGDNPAAWKGNLALLLPNAPRVVKHHPAMPYTDCPAFVQALLAHGTTAARALAFIILTGVRSGEGRGAMWCEIDTGARTWTIPAARMKKRRAHTVPLSGAAMGILDGLSNGGKSDYVFDTGHGAISEAAIRKLMRQTLKIAAATATIHGFRSSFRDWAGESSNYSRELAEVALAHNFGDATERAYRRTEYLEQRRPMMDDWAGYLTATTSPRVIPFPNKMKG